MNRVFLFISASREQAKTEILNKIYRQFTKKKLTSEESRKHFEWFSDTEFGNPPTTMADNSLPMLQKSNDQNVPSVSIQNQPIAEQPRVGKHFLPTVVCQRSRSVAEPLHLPPQIPAPVPATTSSFTRPNILKRQSTRTKENKRKSSKASPAMTVVSSDNAQKTITSVSTSEAHNVQTETLTRTAVVENVQAEAIMPVLERQVPAQGAEIAQAQPALVDKRMQLPAVSHQSLTVPAYNPSKYDANFALGQRNQQFFPPPPLYFPPAYNQNIPVIHSNHNPHQLNNVPSFLPQQQPPAPPPLAPPVLNRHGRYLNEFSFAPPYNTPISRASGVNVMPHNSIPNNPPFVNYGYPQFPPFNNMNFQRTTPASYMPPNLLRVEKPGFVQTALATNEHRIKKVKLSKQVTSQSGSNLSNTEERHHQEAASGTSSRTSEGIEGQLKQLIAIAQNILHHGEENTPQQKIKELSSFISNNHNITEGRSTTHGHEHAQKSQERPVANSRNETATCRKCSSEIEDSSAAATVIRRYSAEVSDNKLSANAPSENQLVNGLIRHIVDSNSQAIVQKSFGASVKLQEEKLVRNTDLGTMETTRVAKQLGTCSKCRLETEIETTLISNSTAGRQKIENNTECNSNRQIINSVISKTESNAVVTPENDMVRYTFPRTTTTVETPSYTSLRTASVIEQIPPISSLPSVAVITLNAATVESPSNQVATVSSRSILSKSTPSPSLLPFAAITVSAGSRELTPNLNLYAFTPIPSITTAPNLALKAPEPLPPNESLVNPPMFLRSKSEPAGSSSANTACVEGASDGTLTAQQYVEELERLKVENVPGEFVEFYEYITRVQIRRRKMPISFTVFLELHNAGSLKILEQQFKKYLEDKRNSTLVTDEVIVVNDDDD